MAVSTDKVNRILTTTLDRYSPEISNELARNDGIVGVFGLRKALKVVTGGELAIETLDVSENSNFAFRSKYAEIATDMQDTRKQAKWAWATIDGAVVINDIEKAINAGESKIYDLVEAEILNAKRTIVRKVADALRASSPTSSDPDSLYTLIPDTDEASQTTSTGGLSRTTYSWWRSRYSSTSMDLSAVGGFETLAAFMMQEVSKGSAKQDRPDFAICSGTLFAALASQGENVRRFSADNKTLELGFDNIIVNGATVIADPSITAGDLYLVNTNHTFIQVLRTPSMQNIGDRPQSIPISVRPFMDAYNALNAASVMHLTFALTTSSNQRNGIATSCS